MALAGEGAYARGRDWRWICEPCNRVRGPGLHGPASTRTKRHNQQRAPELVEFRRRFVAEMEVEILRWAVANFTRDDGPPEAAREIGVCHPTGECPSAIRPLNCCCFAFGSGWNSAPWTSRYKRSRSEPRL